MTALRVIVSGRPMDLDRLIGKGGEGEVYSVSGDPHHAVKLYTTPDRLTRQAKVAAMVRSNLGQRSSLAAFPVAVVQLTDGTFGGFVMRLMSGYRPLHELYAPGSRKHHFPQADYRFLARAATNIARAFASIHATNCVVGDINHSGILISSKATAALIDADSFQFSDDQNRYLCRVGVPEYTPPELQSKPLHGVVRTTDHDAFGLAVVIFQVLLMGRHPFVGTVRKGEIPPLHENVETFRYVYTDGRDVGMDQPPGTPSLADFAPELASLFDRAFSKGSVGVRPSAADWVQALERFESTLSQCPDNPLHYGPKDASECAWCDMERLLGTRLFVPYLPSGPATPNVDFGGVAFDLDAIWARIERLRFPTVDQLQPPVPRTSRLQPSASARLAENTQKRDHSVFGAILIAAAVVVMVAAPKAWFLALAIGSFGYTRLGVKHSVNSIDSSPFDREYVNAQNLWHLELGKWRAQLGVRDITTLKDELRAARQLYLDTKTEERRLVEEYKLRRKERQLTSYLEAFDIARAGIKGIGPAKLAVLASFGIDTAADVSDVRLQAVPGFGDALIMRMVDWRTRHESRFVYNAATNDADRQEIARVAALIEAKLAPLRRKLLSGVQDLESRARRVQEFMTRVDPVVVDSYNRLEQARIDLEFLGIPIPNSSSSHTTQRGSVQPPSPSSPSYSHQPQRPTSRPQSASSVPTCPRCGSGMTARLARRGRNAGNYFWGCLRYPKCKGTRSI